MESTLISGIKLGSVIAIEFTISDYGGGPRFSDPLRFMIWWEAKIALNSGKHHT